MTEDTEQTPKPNVKAACFLALLVLFSTTAILIHDAGLSLPRGPGIQNPRPDPAFLNLIAPTDWRLRLVEGPTNNRPREKVESPWNANRSGHWATATLMSLAVPWVILKILAMFGFRNLL